MTSRAQGVSTRRRTSVRDTFSDVVLDVLKVDVEGPQRFVFDPALAHVVVYDCCTERLWSGVTTLVRTGR